VAFCFDDEISRNTLKGLSTFNVEIFVPNEIKPIEQQSIKKALELRLRGEGITLIDASTGQKFDAILHIEVTLVPEELSCSYGIHTEVYQNVKILHGAENHYAPACTWSVGIIGQVGMERLASIHDSIGNTVDTFVEAYYSVNKE
jgi:hypothetical protein